MQRGHLPGASINEFRRVGVRAAALIFTLWVSDPAAAQENKLLHSVELCNGAAHPTEGAQIEGCTDLIKSSQAATSVGLSIAYNNRGNAYTSQGMYDLAIADYDRAITLNPRFAKAYNNRGVAYARHEDRDRAKQNFEAAIELDSNYVNAYINRGDVYLKEKRFELALHDYDSAIKLQRANSKAWTGRCWVQAQFGHLIDALKDCEQAIRVGAEPGALEARGVVHLKMKLWDAAISDYDAALKLDAKRPIALYGRGLAKAKKGNTAGADADIAAARQIDLNISTNFKSAGLE